MPFPVPARLFSGQNEAFLFLQSEESQRETEIDAQRDCHDASVPVWTVNSVSKE